MKFNLVIVSKNKKLQKYANQLKQDWNLLESMIIDIYSLCGITSFLNRLPINLIYGRKKQRDFCLVFMETSK